MNDVLPGSVFDRLTAEDLHLLMNGSPVVDVEVLKKITSFMDESRECHMTLGASYLVVSYPAPTSANMADAAEGWVWRLCA